MLLAAEVNSSAAYHGEARERLQQDRSAIAGCIPVLADVFSVFRAASIIRAALGASRPKGMLGRTPKARSPDVHPHQRLQACTGQDRAHDSVGIL